MLARCGAELIHRSSMAQALVPGPAMARFSPRARQAPIQGRASHPPRSECHSDPLAAMSSAWVWARPASWSSQARPPMPLAPRSWLIACTMSPVAPLPGLPGGAHAAAANATATTATRGAVIRHRRAGCRARLPVGLETAGGPVTAVRLGGVSWAMAERVMERIPLAIQRVSTSPQLRRCVPIAQGEPSPLRQLVVDNSLPVVAALATIVAVIATVMAWRAGRRARRAADLVAQLLEPPVLEPPVLEPPVPETVA